MNIIKCVLLQFVLIFSLLFLQGMDILCLKFFGGVWCVQFMLCWGFFLCCFVQLILGRFWLIYFDLYMLRFVVVVVVERKIKLRQFRLNWWYRNLIGIVISLKLLQWFYLWVLVSLLRFYLKFLIVLREVMMVSQLKLFFLIFGFLRYNRNWLIGFSRCVGS